MPNSMIIGGVTIGAGTVIGAMNFVDVSTPPGTVLRAHSRSLRRPVPDEK